MFRALVPILSTLLLSIPLYAESGYQLDRNDLLIGGAAGALFGSSRIVPEVEGDQLPRNQLFGLDARVVRPYDSQIDRVGTVTAATALLLPAVPLLGELRSPSTLATYAVMYLEGFVATAGTKELLKARVSRWRPYTYEENRDDPEMRNSFPSGHTAYAFYGATFLATTVATDYGEQGWARPLALSGYCLAGSTAVLRVMSGEHFVTDVLAGAAIGSLWGWLIPRLHETPREGGVTLSAHPSGVFLSYAY